MWPWIQLKHVIQQGKKNRKVRMCAQEASRQRKEHTHTHKECKKKKEQKHLPLPALRPQQRRRPRSSPCHHSSAFRSVFTTQRQMVSWHWSTLMSLGGLQEAHLSAQFYFSSPPPLSVSTSTEEETGHWRNLDGIIFKQSAQRLQGGTKMFTVWYTWSSNETRWDWRSCVVT